MQMPDMDGFRATRHARNPHSAACNHQIPIIAMIAGALQGGREKCLEVAARLPDLENRFARLNESMSKFLKHKG